MSEIVAPLTPVSTLEILGENYDLAKNGQDFHLVQHREPDAYGRPVARRVALSDWISEQRLLQPTYISVGEARVQSLLNVIGQSLSRIKSLEDELSRAHAALQREAEPDAKPRRAVAAREQSAGVSGILEPGKEE